MNVWVAQNILYHDSSNVNFSLNGILFWDDEIGF